MARIAAFVLRPVFVPTTGVTKRLIVRTIIALDLFVDTPLQDGAIAAALIGNPLARIGWLFALTIKITWNPRGTGSTFTTAPV